MNVARSALHADFIYLLSLLGIKEGALGLWHSGLGLHRPKIYVPRWTTHPCILYHVCDDLIWCLDSSPFLLVGFSI